MRGLKRGQYALIVISLFVLLSALGYAGWCLDPISALYCQESTEEQCCSGTCNPSSLYDSGTAMPAECASAGCCFSLSLGADQVCQEGAVLEADCDDEWALTCSGISDSKCDIACCCYTEDTVELGEVMPKGICEGLTDFVFHPTIIQAQACSEECTGSGQDPGDENETQCNDDEDNDGDGLIDLSDPGCSSEEDDSETDPLVQCDDGLDNDGDGDIDGGDSCCIDYPDREEDFCELPDCTTTGQISTAVDACNCRDSDKCSGGEYCCISGCQQNPCGSSNCISGSRMSCGTFTLDGCEEFKYCYDGTWGTECSPDPACAFQAEICTDGTDNNGDGRADCDDVFCHAVPCTPGESTCDARGYFDPVDSVKKCCYTGTVNDCTGPGNIPDGILDTCGTCSCLTDHPAPFFTSLTQQLGEKALFLEWGVNCQIDTAIYRCEKGDTECEDANDPGFSRIADSLDTSTYEDYGIENNTEYCYIIKAEYDTEDVPSEVKCIEAGDYVCMVQSSQYFCTDKDFGLTGERVKEAYCDINNKVSGTNCPSGYVCTGPLSNGKTDCVYQSDCDECGEPLNMFADYLTSRATYKVSSSPAELDSLCSAIPTCYFDYSETNVDMFHECQDVFSCYDYRSEFACEEQGISDTNNKCLGRDCEWQPISGTLDLGVCMESVSTMQDCGACNDAAHNGVFDVCTVDRCRQFGDCFLNPIGECIDAADITCEYYTTQEHCEGGRAVSVNVAYDAYGERISGAYDNELTPSLDYVGIGLCKWSSAFGMCFKDADDDGQRDPNPKDRHPPQTKVLTPTKVRTLNITFEVSDANPDGSVGSGPMFLYVCRNNTGWCYPTDSYILDAKSIDVSFGGGHGMHDVYFYAEDLANNLEVVKKETFDIDRSPPEITIEAYPVHDQTEPYTNSNITFVVTLNEPATCTDTFDDTGLSKIPGWHGDRWVVAYTSLTDGTYTYKVNCTDDQGNTAVSYLDTRIFADGGIFDPKPRGIIDSTPVELGLSTLKNVQCRYGVDENTYENLPNSFQPAVAVDSYFYHHSIVDLEDSGTYRFDVKCDLGTRISDDEIQFVYDIDVPVTRLLDVDGKIFDTTKFYSDDGIKDKIFLDCIDGPENGFGCNKTLYCVSNSRCDPVVENDPLLPIEYELTASSETWICYYSEENEVGGFGGKVEDTVCHQVKIDRQPPTLQIDRIQNRDSKEEAYVTTDNTFRLSGKVIDPDALSAPHNKVRIIVNLEGSDEENEYFLEFNSDTFQEYIDLFDGMNIITVQATDRSGATDTKTVYISVVEYTGEKITLIAPNKFGVSRTRIFDFTVQTYRDAECRFSINDGTFQQSEPMVPAIELVAEDTYNYFHTKTDYELGELSEVEESVFVKCKDNNGLIYAKVFNLSWDDSKPVIEDIYISPSDGKEYPTVVEFPLVTNLTVETDDYVRCKYSEHDVNYVSGMTEFDAFQTQLLNKINVQTLDNLQDFTRYLFYVQCENGAGDISEKKLFRFAVNTSMDTGIKFLSPPKLTSNTTVTLRISTTKSTSNCMYGTDSDPDTPMIEIDSKNHKAELNLAEGKYTYYVECLTFSERVSDYYSFKIDTTPPEPPVVQVSATTWHIDELSAKWDAKDNLSKVKKYNYSIGTTKGGTDIFDWHTTNDEKEKVDDLNLTNGTTYYWTVIAMNELGMWSSPGYSNGTRVDISGAKKWTNGTDPPILNPGYDSCDNGQLDGNESDIDCGGVCQWLCALGKKCETGADCISKYCVDGVCTEASCEDGSVNGDESDVDCGGTKCDACELGKSCFYDNDCVSLYCKNKVCSEATCSDGVRNQGEDGIDCGGPCPDECFEPYLGCNSDADCDEGEICINNRCEGSGNPPGEEPKSKFWTWFFLILIIIAVLGVGGYFGYIEYQKHQLPPPGKPGRQSPGSPMRPAARVSTSGHPVVKPKSPQEKYLDSLSSMIRKRRSDMKKKDRGELLSSFDDTSEKLPLKGTPGKTLLKPVGKLDSKARSQAIKQAAGQPNVNAQAPKKPVAPNQQPAKQPSAQQAKGPAAAPVQKSTMPANKQPVQKSPAGKQPPQKGPTATPAQKSPAKPPIKEPHPDVMKGLSEVAGNKKGDAVKDLKKIAKK